MEFDFKRLDQRDYESAVSDFGQTFLFGESVLFNHMNDLNAR